MTSQKSERTSIADPCSYKLIYILRINNSPKHKGLLKIGDTSLKTPETKNPTRKFPPNCEELKKASAERAAEYTRTAGFKAQILHCELAIDDRGNAFRDYNVHRVLENSGFRKEELNNAREWFRIDLNSAISVIEATKRGEKFISKNSPKWSPIDFREEQKRAIKLTMKHFSAGGKKFLWDAKMRFGKTLSALEVVKRMKFQKTIIVTHRPAVKDGWFEDFEKIFGEKDNQYQIGGRERATFADLEKSKKPFVYFASLQDLRGSDEISKKGFNKNHKVFKTAWDLVIVDEAHEGTTTDLGEDAIKALLKRGAHLLSLSGTPFNISNDFSETEKFTWDYIQEQRAKREWEEKHPGEPNPYASLPEMKIFTYSLGKILNNPEYIEVEDKCFKFSEFFRVNDNGKFVHEKDVKNFLDLLVGKSKNTETYPFATKEFREFFLHTFWIVPGVREAAALTKLLEKHDVFGCFEIINIAGDGNADEDEKFESELARVKSAIRERERTITLSCGKLTTGVSVPEWTAVFYLAGGSKTSPATYMQTIFRVQTPGSINGRAKEKCYAFDFAPDRALAIANQVAELSTGTDKKARDREKLVREKLDDFTNFLPIIAVDGSETREVDTNYLLGEINRICIAEVVRRGFDSPKLFNNKLWELTDKDFKKFEDLEKIVGKRSLDSEIEKEISVNNQGFDNPEQGSESSGEKPKSPKISPEEKERRDNRKKAISTLLNATVRVPLLVFGADGDVSKPFEPLTFPENFDDASWAEFMGKLTKKDFCEIVAPYLNETVFKGACTRIRERVLAADALPPRERIEKIVEIHSEFKNPDKETVLTPWRVVNRQLGDTLGGENFFDKNYAEPLEFSTRSISRGNATKETLGNADAKILEINSKTGFYPLYAAFSLMHAKLAADPHSPRRNESIDDAAKRLWNNTVSENIFVICRTKMAAAITRRTLVGFDKTVEPNIRVCENLIEQVADANALPQLLQKIKAYSTWKISTRTDKMEFDAIIGNPPYQEPKGTNIIPIFNKFVELSKALNPRYISMIMPSRWMKGGNRGLDAFLKTMLDDTHFEIFHDFTNSQEIFPNVDIKGGVCYFRRAREHNGKCDYTLHDISKTAQTTRRFLKTEGCETFIRHNSCISILEKIRKFNEDSFSNLVSFREPYGLKTNFFKRSGKNLRNTDFPGAIKIHGLDEKNNRIVKYVPETFFHCKDKDGKRQIDKTLENRLKSWKIFVPKAYGCGAIGEVIPTPILATPMTACTETFLQIGSFSKKSEAENALSYLKTKTFRLLLGLKKITQDCPRDKWSFIPVQDFSKPWTDKKLYAKYGFSDDEIAFIEKMIRRMD